MRVEQQRCADLLRLFGVQPLFPRLGGNHRFANHFAAEGLVVLAQEHVRKQPRLFRGETHIRAATALNGIAILRVFADGLFKGVVRLLIERILQIVHAGEVAENRLGRAVKRLRNGSSVYRGHSLLAEHGK